MRTVKNLLAIAAFLMLATSCKNNQEPEVKTVEVEYAEEKAETTVDPNASYAKVEFGIDGMTCAMGCAKTIEKKMAKMDGVKSAKVDFEKELAMVEYDEAKVSPASLEEAVAKAGDVYKVRDMKQVEEFSTEKKACKEDCKMACCKDKTEAEKLACAKDCKMDCCAKKA